MSFAGQIEYNSIIINFVRQWNNFAIRKAQNQAISRSAARVRETLNFANQDLIQAVKERLTAQELAELLQFYEFAKGGASFAFLRDRDLGAYWNFEKTLNNNDENPLTFTRTAGTAGNASYIDPSTGLLTFEDTLNIPRYDSGKYGHGVVVEGARTNIIQESTDFTGAGWAVVDITAADDTTEVLDPAGGNNAAKLTADDDVGTITYTTAVQIDEDDGVFSVYIRCPSGTVAGTLIINDSDGNELSTAGFTATPIWQRVQAVHESSGDINFNWIAIIRIATGGEIIYAYGAQLEVGTDFLFASNYISTDGATKTRNAELAAISATNILGDLKGTVMFWIKPQWVYNKHIALWLVENGTPAGDPNLKMVVDTAGRLGATIASATGSDIGVLPGLSSMSQNTWHHIAMTYDTTISNGIKAYLDGSLLATSSNDAFVPKPVQTNVYIGTNRAGNFHAHAVFDEILIRKDVLPGSSIAQIAAQGVGLGEIRNRWPAVALSNPDFLEEQLKGINRYNYILSMEEILS